MIWAQCLYCKCPALHDVLGRTDHVCADSPGAELFASLMNTHGTGKTYAAIMMESTAQGEGNAFYKQWQEDSIRPEFKLKPLPWWEE